MSREEPDDRKWNREDYNPWKYILGLGCTILLLTGMFSFASVIPQDISKSEINRLNPRDFHEKAIYSATLTENQFSLNIEDLHLILEYFRSDEPKEWIKSLVESFEHLSWRDLNTSIKSLYASFEKFHLSRENFTKEDIANLPVVGFEIPMKEFWAKDLNLDIIKMAQTIRDFLFISSNVTLENPERRRAILENILDDFTLSWKEGKTVFENFDLRTSEAYGSVSKLNFDEARKNLPIMIKTPWLDELELENLEFRTENFLYNIRDLWIKSENVDLKTLSPTKLVAVWFQDVKWDNSKLKMDNLSICNYLAGL